MLALTARGALGSVTYTPVLNLDKPSKGTADWHLNWASVMDKLEALRTQKGVLSARPSPGPKTRLYVAVDCADKTCATGGGTLTCIQRTNDNGTTWETVVCAAGGDMTGASSSADGEVPLFSGTGGKTLKRSAANGICVGLKNPRECCVSAGVGTCYPHVDTSTGQLVAVSIDTAAKKTIGSCVSLKEATDNAPTGGNPNVIQQCAPDNVPADKKVIWTSNGTLDGHYVQNPTGTSGVCARFATDGNGNPTLAASSEDCITHADIQPVFVPSRMRHFFDDFLTGSTSSGSITALIGLGWSSSDNTLGSTNCVNNTITGPIANHAGLYMVSTGTTANRGCALRQTSGSGAVYPTNLTTSTTWAMQWSGARHGVLTNYMWHMGLGGASQADFINGFPDKFIGVIWRKTDNGAPGYCKASGQPFGCCTAATTGACNDTNYVLVSCNGTSNSGPCTEVDTGVAPSGADVFDKFQLQMAASGIAQLGIAIGDGDESYDAVTVSTNIPSFTSRFTYAVGTTDTVQKQALIDWFDDNDPGLSR
jgi:hypothetical protein